MKKNARYWINLGYAVICICVGCLLFALSIADIVDSFWGGVGSGLFVVGIFRLIQMYRLQKDEEYREQVEVETTDERNSFIRNKAWAWAGYTFVLIASITAIVLKVLGHEVLCMAAAFSVAFIVLLFWGFYIILRRKY